MLGYQALHSLVVELVDNLGRLESESVWGIQTLASVDKFQPLTVPGQHRHKFMLRFLLVKRQDRQPMAFGQCPDQVEHCTSPAVDPETGHVSTHHQNSSLSRHLIRIIWRLL